MIRRLLLPLLTLLLVAACDDDPGGPAAPVNRAPAITSLSAEPAVVPVGQSTVLSAAAEDADGDGLSYAWSAFEGFFPDGADGASVRWSPPARMGAFTLTVTVSDGEATARDSLTVNAAVPEVGIAPMALDLGETGVEAAFTVTNAGAGVLGWTASGDRAWLSVDPAGGDLAAGAEAVVTVTADRGLLDTGLHTGGVTVATPFGSGRVTVSLTELPPPVLLVSDLEHDFGATETAWSFDVSNGGGGAVAWSIASPPVGITVAPSSGEVTDGTDTVAVTLDRASYPPGLHEVALVVDSDANSETVDLSFEAVGGGATYTNLFFLHHSTGRNLIAEGDVRARIAAIDPGLEFWDHDYNAIGLMNPAGTLTGTSYNIPGDNTDPDGLHTLWTTDNTARARILANHEVIAFKSCYPASDIGSAAELEQYKTWYREIRDFLDTQSDRVFVIMSPPPRHRLATDADDAARARAFADWLGGAEYLDGHPNLVCFDLFDALAGDDDVLRYEYERSHSDGDSHPNATANAAVGPRFAAALAAAAGSARR